ncbi:PAS domain S-box protein [bacterium]|nr:PAS domain S-box protein [bacterium]
MQLLDRDLPQEHVVGCSGIAPTAERSTDRRSRLHHLFWPSLAGDHEDGVQNPLFSTVLLFVAVAAIVNLISAPFVLTTHVGTSVEVSLAVVFIVVLVRHAAHRKGTHFASVFLVVALTGSIAWPVMLQGIHSAAYSAFIVLILIGTTLLGLGTGATIAAVAALIGTLAMYLEGNGILTPEPFDPFVIWLTHLFYFGTAVAVVSIAHRQIQTNLHCLQESEQRLTENNRLLTESEEMFRTMTENLLAAIFIVDNGRIAYANPMAETFTGYSPAELQGVPFAELIHPTVWPQIRSTLNSLITGEQAQARMQFCTDSSHVSSRWVDCSSSVLSYKGHSAILTICVDITEQIEAKNALEAERSLLAQHVAERTADLTQANLQLARIARHKDEFLASMSHELRTPLNGILGTAEAMSEEIYGPLNQKQLSRLRNIEESGHHLLSLINDVLDMAKIEAGKLTFEMDSVEVKTICEASLRLTRQAALAKHLNISVHLDPEVTHVQTDGRRLKQMLINLLSNAIKFTPDGGEIGLRVAQDRNAGVVKFTVWDTGIGINVEHQKRLFQPFVQVDSSLARHHGGSGLGLAIVQKMAQLQGGAISLKSAPNQGSEFTITLPHPAGNFGGGEN